MAVECRPTCSTCSSEEEAWAVCPSVVAAELSLCVRASVRHEDSVEVIIPCKRVERSANNLIVSYKHVLLLEKVQYFRHERAAHERSFQAHIVSILCELLV